MFTFGDSLKFIFKGAFFLGATALIFAFAAEYMFNLSPCILCIYERIPYALSLLCGLLGWIHPKAAPKVLIISLFLSFIAGSALSFYHAGIERGIFFSFGACGGTSKALEAESVEELESLVLATPIVRCDQVSFRFLGLSLTEYNFLCSFFITGLLGFALYKAQRNKIYNT